MKITANSPISARWISAVLFFFFLFPLAGAEVALLHETPCFTTPNCRTEPVEILAPGSYSVKGAGKRCFSTRHPLSWYNTFYQLESGRWISPELTVDAERNVSRAYMPDWRFYGCAVAFAVVLAAGAGLFFCRNALNSSQKKWLLIAVPVFLRIGLLLYELSYWGNVIPSAADDPGYFRTIFDMLHGSFAGPWNFTIGLGFLYAPFILLANAKEFYGIAVVFDHFNALVIAPCALVLGFLVLEKLKIRRRCVFAAVMIWAVYPFFVSHTELWNSLHFYPVFALPPSWGGGWDWWRYYAICINCGFNAMSDTPSWCAVLACVWFTLRVPARKRWCLIAGMIFGFCCLLRINNIFFAPLLCFLWLKKIPLQWKCAGLFILCAAIGFLLVFGLQFWVNYHQFGNILSFGYKLHYLDFAPEKRPCAGFTFSTLCEWRNTKFLIFGNLALFAAGIAGLTCLKERFTRIALTLFSIPLVLFFLGYSHTYCDVRRFIMAVFLIFPAAFCAALAPEQGKRRWFVLPLALALWFIPSAELLALFLVFLLLRALWDLQGELFGGILSKCKEKQS